MKFSQGIIGKAILGAVMIHAGEKYFTCTSFLSFLRPGKKFFVCWIFAAMGVYGPRVFNFTGINRQDDALRTERFGEFINKLWIAHCCGINADFICTRFE